MEVKLYNVKDTYFNKGTLEKMPMWIWDVLLGFKEVGLLGWKDVEEKTGRKDIFEGL
jgi:hypothetical protein